MGRGETLTSVVKVIVTGCLTLRLLEDIYIYIYRSYEVCCLCGFFFYHIPSCSFGSVSLYHYIYDCKFCILLFNFVNYIFLLLWLCFLLLLCMFCSVLCILFSLCCSVYCFCVNVYFTIATGSQPNCS